MSATSLVAALKTYLFPNGESVAHGIRGIRAMQRGEIRSSAEARWNPFVANEFVAATTTGFCWDARLGSGVLSVAVTDAYVAGHGRLVVAKGPLQLKKLIGPDVDQGELQRYLGYVGYCPPMMLNNPSLEFAAVGERTLKVSDRHDKTGASVEMQLGEDGRPVLIRAVRPMIVGKRVLPTAWSAIGSDPQEWEGMRVWRHMEAAWHLADGPFTYVRIDLTSFTALR
jgi:Family of unknown function (DUF6544)